MSLNIFEREDNKKRLTKARGPLLAQPERFLLPLYSVMLLHLRTSVASARRCLRPEMRVVPVATAWMPHPSRVCTTHQVRHAHCTPAGDSAARAQRGPQTAEGAVRERLQAGAAAAFPAGASLRLQPRPMPEPIGAGAMDVGTWPASRGTAAMAEMCVVFI